MARVECEVSHVLVELENGPTVNGVQVTCNECGHEEHCAGETARSVRRALMQCRENCPEGQENFYVASDGEDKD